MSKELTLAKLNTRNNLSNSRFNSANGGVGSEVEERFAKRNE